MNTQTYTLESISGPCFGLALRLTGNKEQAEDITQEVILKLLARDLGEIKRLDSYAFKLVRNKIIDEGRRQDCSERAYQELMKERKAIETICPSKIAEQTEEKSIYARAIGLLPDEVSSTIRAHYFDGLSREENAEFHNISLGGVKARLAKGKDELRRHLSKKLVN